jgi:hypothetical protein
MLHRFTARRGLQQRPPASFLIQVVGGVCLAGLMMGIPPDVAAAQGARTQTSVIRIVDQAIRALGDPSSDYRKVVADAATVLPGDAEDSTRVAVRRVLARMPEPDADFRCSADFVRAQARKALLRIRDTLLNVSSDRGEPAVCYAVPFAIDLTRVNTANRWLHIYGYDFDTVAPEIIVVTRDGHRDITPALATVSHYHLILDLASVSTSARDVSIGVVWDHLIRHSVALIQPTTRLCATHVETIPAATTIFEMPAGLHGLGVVTRPGARVWADASLDYENNKMDATICMTVDWGREVGIVGGCTDNFVHTTDPDSTIEGIVGSVRSYISFRRGTGPTATLVSRGGPVRQWRFSGFGVSGSEAPSVTAELTAIRIVSTADNGCLSAQAYLEARRTSALSGDTQRAMDPQLRRVDPVILSLRPRFAPKIYAPHGFDSGTTRRNAR